MDTINLVFSRSHNPGSLLIRLLTWSTWSHVALIDGDQVIEAVWPRVREISLDEFKSLHSATEIVSLLCYDEKAIIAAARSQIGKPYDWTAVIGIGLHRDWQEDDSWFCSELVAWAFAKARNALFRTDRMRRVTPENLWMLAPYRPTQENQQSRLERLF